jgi:hypothetical protein
MIEMSPYTSPETPTNPSGRFTIARAVLVLILTAVIAASSIVMIGPQIMLIVPLALVAGIVVAMRRSFWSLVCFGYPFLFGLVSAWIGYKEMPGYERTMAFAISIGIGVVGVVMVAVGLWKALSGRKA